METHSRLFWVNLVSLCSVLALSEAARGIVTPVLTLFVTTLGGSPFFLSLVVAAFSIGRLIASVVYGLLSDRITVRWILLSALIITVIGHVLYIVAEPLPSGGLYVLLVGRTFAGFGTAILSAARAYVSKNTSTGERTQFMAWLGIVQFAGFAFTPILGGFPVQWTLADNWVITSFTAGTYIVLILDSVLIGIIWFVLKDDSDEQVSTDTGAAVADSLSQFSEQQQLTLNDANVLSPSVLPEQRLPSPSDLTPRSQTTSPTVEHPTDVTATLPNAPTLPRRLSAPAIIVTAPLANDAHPDPLAALRASQPESPQSSLFTPILFIILNATSRGCLAVAEAYGAVLYYQVQYGQQYDPKHVNSVTESLFFTVLGGIGVLVFMTMHRFTRYVSELTQLVCGFVCLTIGFVTVIDLDRNLSMENLAFSMALIYCIATPLNNTLVASMLSKQLPRGSQGYWMGLLTAAGSVGRIVFPLMSGALYSAYSTNAALLIPVIVALLSVLSVLIGLKAYRPWYDYWREFERRIVRWVHNRHRQWRRTEYDRANVIIDDIDDEEIEDAWMTAEEIVERSKRKAAKNKARGIFGGGRRHSDSDDARQAENEAEMMQLPVCDSESAYARASEERQALDVGGESSKLSLSQSSSAARRKVTL